jgi:hypothetical protein
MPQYLTWATAIEAEEAGFRFFGKSCNDFFACNQSIYSLEFETAKTNNGIVVALL